MDLVMAHFAELEEKTDPTGFTSDTHLIVKQVTVVANDVETAAGPLGENDMHVDGETWCKNFFNKPDTNFKQTSYNSNFRKQYAGIGYTYDETKDVFIMPQPYQSWSLDSNNDWQAPVTYPTATTYTSNGVEKHYVIYWNEDNLRWIAYDGEDPVNGFNWDASALAWVPA